MKPPFTSSQEMYNYAANQVINQELSQEAVKNNLMERGVTDADAEIVIQNMLVAIEKRKKAESGNVQVGSNVSQQAFSTNGGGTSVKASEYGSFATMQEMYNYAADQLIVKKLSQQTVKLNLMNQGISATEADVVIKNMMDQIAKKKPVEVNAKRAEGKRMMLVGLIVAVVGGVLYGAGFTIAGESFVVSYGIMVVGGILFFKGLFKMF